MKRIIGIILIIISVIGFFAAIAYKDGLMHMFGFIAFCIIIVAWGLLIFWLLGFYDD
jgi:hypothetical protein